MKTISFVLLIVLVGCQTSQPAQPSIPPNPGLACNKNSEKRPEFTIIAGKVALPTRAPQQAFEMLSNTTKPNTDEKIAIAEWIKGKQACADMTLEWQKQYHFPPLIAAIGATAFSTFLNLTADLYNGKLTYGEYARNRAEITARFDQQLAEATQHLQEQEAADYQQRRNLAMQYLLNQQRTAPIYTPVVPYQIPIPKTTNCNFIGNQMHCTTQ